MSKLTHDQAFLKYCLRKGVRVSDTKEALGFTSDEQLRHAIRELAVVMREQQS